MREIDLNNAFTISHVKKVDGKMYAILSDETKAQIEQHCNRQVVEGRIGEVAQAQKAWLNNAINSYLKNRRAELKSKLGEE